MSEIDFEDKLKEVEKYIVAAQQGNQYAQMNLDHMAWGRHNDGSYTTKTIKCLKAEALYILGKAYGTGYVVDQDRDKEHELLDMAADLGHRDAQYIMGAVYYEGVFKDKDEERGIYLWRKAYAQGDPLAKHELSKLGLI